MGQDLNRNIQEIFKRKISYSSLSYANTEFSGKNNII